MLRVGLKAISVSQLNKDNEKPTQSGDTQDPKEGFKSHCGEVRLAGLVDIWNGNEEGSKMSPTF